MKRATVFLDERLEHDLRLLARQDRRPTAALVREALEGYVSKRLRSRRTRLAFLAVGRSRRSDTAERHEELLFAALAPHGRKRLRRRERRGPG
jgi:predicted transcriptional regulator